MIIIKTAFYIEDRFASLLYESSDFAGTFATELFAWLPGGMKLVLRFKPQNRSMGCTDKHNHLIKCNTTCKATGYVVDLTIPVENDEEWMSVP